MDQELRNRLSNHQPELNPQVWDNIAFKTAGSPMTPRWKRWWVIGSAILLTSGFLFYMLFPSGDNVTLKNESVTQINNASIKEKTSLPNYKHERVTSTSQRESIAKADNLDINKIPVSSTKVLERSDINDSEQSVHSNTAPPFVKNEHISEVSVSSENFLSPLAHVFSTNSFPELSKLGYVQPISSFSEIDGLEETIKKKKKTIENRHSIDAMGGVLISYRTLNADGNSALIDHKNQNEKKASNSTYGLLYAYKISEKLEISTGIIKTSYGEAYDFQHVLISHSAINKYNYISIPLSLRRQIASFNRWSIALGIGAKYNFLNAAKSSWVDLATVSAISHSNENKQESPFNEKTISWNGDLYFKYKISPKVHFTIQETIDRFGNSIYKEDVNLDQKPYSFNTTISLGVDF